MRKLLPAPARAALLALSVATMAATGCYKKDIQFGTGMADSETSLLLVDSVHPLLSTLLLDSFVTSGLSEIWVGTATDPETGSFSSVAYLAVAPQQLLVLPDDASFDSLCLELRTYGTYMGDTLAPFTLMVRQLDERINAEAEPYLYNTRAFAVKPTVIAQHTTRLRPAAGDSLRLRISQGMGQDLFDRIRAKDETVSSQESFLDYFKGLHLSAGGSALFRFQASSAGLRLHYHTSFPFKDTASLWIPLAESQNQYNQVSASRQGTVFDLPGETELPAALTSEVALQHQGSGAFVKIAFPSLRDLASLGMKLSIIKAELVVRPLQNSLDDPRFVPPSHLMMVVTDAGNGFGSRVVDSTGEATQYAALQNDFLFKQNAHYRFNVTPYIKQWYSQGGFEDAGFILLSADPSVQTDFNRLLVASGHHTGPRTQLLLTVLKLPE